MSIAVKQFAERVSAVCIAAACFAAPAPAEKSESQSAESISPPAKIHEPRPEYVTGIADRIAVWAAPDSTAQPIAWLPAKTVLRTSGADASGDWLRIDAPDSISVWIYRDCVRNGAVCYDRTRVRSGPGMTCPALAELPRGAKAELRGKYGDWLRIKAPRGIAFWVLRSSVDIAESPVERARSEFFARLLSSFTNAPPAEADAAAGMTNALAVATNGAAGIAAGAADSAAPSEPPPELAGYALRRCAGQGRKATIEGSLDWCIDNEAPFPFCIVRVDSNGDVQRLCQVFLDERAYAASIGARISVSGSLWQLESSSFPVLVPYSVSFLPR